MQVLFVHGGEAFANTEDYYEYLRTKDCDPFSTFTKWKDTFPELLAQFGCESFFPEMPNKYNSDYEAWKIWFERHFEFLTDEKIILVGGSLGGIFLVKYLSENKMPKNIAQLHLISAPFGDVKETGDVVVSFAFNPENLKNIKADKIFLYHSKDDPVVPFSHAEKFMQYLDAELFVFEDKGHFQVEEFPELLANIKKLA